MHWPTAIMYLKVYDKFLNKDVFNKYHIYFSMQFIRLETNYKNIILYTYVKQLET